MMKSVLDLSQKLQRLVMLRLRRAGARIWAGCGTSQSFHTHERRV